MSLSTLTYSIIPKQKSVLTERLHQACQQMGVSITEQQGQQLLWYLDQLLLWNKAYNLTAITEVESAFIKHLLDCLSIMPHLPSGSLLDVGTGAGLPAMMVAIVQPDRAVTMLDSNQKKIRFLRQVCSQLGLTHAHPVASRIEAFSGSFAVITSRAFACIEDFVSLTTPYLAADGTLVAMRGQAPTSVQMQLLAQQWQIELYPLSVPDLSEERHLLLLKPLP